MTIDEKTDELSKFEERLGLEIARSVSPKTRRNDCPDIIYISALVDGALEGDKKTDTIKHITRCKRCHELYVGTIQTLIELEKQEKGEIIDEAEIESEKIIPFPHKEQHTLVEYPDKKKAGKLKRLYLSIPAAAAIFIIYILNVPMIPSSSMMATNLNISHSELSESMGDHTIYWDKIIHFGMGSDREKTLLIDTFHVGILLAQLELGLKAQDVQSGEEILTRLRTVSTQLNDPMPLLKEIDQSLKMITTKGQMSDSESLHKEFQSRLNRKLRETEQKTMMLFGEWVFMGYIAAKNANVDFITEHCFDHIWLVGPTPVSYFRTYFADIPGDEYGFVTKTLTEIEDIKDSGDMNNEKLSMTSEKLLSILKFFQNASVE